MPSRTRSSRSRWVAAMMRTSTISALRPPTGVTSPDCSTRSSFACRSSGMSPISSRKSVPPLASRKRPAREFVAPVKAPRSWPKSSLSSSSRGIAAALTATKGPSARGLAAWMARATSSLPVPLSPVIRTGTLRGATLPTVLKISSRAELEPTSRSPPGATARPTARRSVRTSSFSARVASAFSARAFTAASAKGFTR